MKPALSRRNFIKRSGALGLGAAAFATGPSVLRALGANERLRVGVIGCNSRGMAHISGLLGVPNVEVAYVCDVDRRALEKGIAAAVKKQGPSPKGEKDLRRLMEAKDLDAVTIATPDHWHAPATIMACAAGKHVYVEKPGSHNAQEGQWMVQAARKQRRVVQLGNQRRSWPWVIEAIEALRGGELGRVSFARCWYTNNRGSIGRGKAARVPEWLDYELWQGPAPEQPYKDNVIHYNWHWFWNWGTGELGNNGVHALDLARWGMHLDLPKRITCAGGRYFAQDDWETPDTCAATFDFGDKAVVWDGQSCAPRGFENTSFGCLFHGEKGALALAGNEAVFYDHKNKELRRINGKQTDLFQFDSLHFANFADAIREGKPARSEIEDAQKSTLLCHLGNIAYRSREVLEFDPGTHRLKASAAAEALWGRAYRPDWKPIL